MKSDCMAEDKRLRTYWIDKAKDMNLPYLFGYYAWLINEELEQEKLL